MIYLYTLLFLVTSQQSVNNDLVDLNFVSINDKLYTKSIVTWLKNFYFNDKSNYFSRTDL